MLSLQQPAFRLRASSGSAVRTVTPCKALVPPTFVALSAKPASLFPARFTTRQDAQAKRATTIIRRSAGDDVAPLDPETAQLKKSAGFLRSLSFLSFWSQLALSIVSGLILVFSVTVTKQGQGPDISKWAGLVGVILGLLSTFFAHGFNRIAKKLQRDEKVSQGWIVNSLITNNTLNLFGLGAAIIGLQSSIGTLVAKSLMTSNGFVYPPPPGGQLASLDIFALQALGNILLSHFISLGFTNMLLRSINKPSPQAA